MIHHNEKHFISEDFWISDLNVQSSNDTVWLLLLSSSSSFRSVCFYIHRMKAEIGRKELGTDSDFLSVTKLLFWFLIATLCFVLFQALYYALPLNYVTTGNLRSKLETNQQTVRKLIDKMTREGYLEATTANKRLGLGSDLLHVLSTVIYNY